MRAWTRWWALGGLAALAIPACANGLLSNEEDGGTTADGSLPDVGGSDAHADAGKPEAACTAPDLTCGGQCVDLQSDPNHCGACTNACSTTDAGDPGDAGTITAVCEAGACNVLCGGSLSQCGAQCFNLQNDPNHCGACASACDGGACCSAACTDTMNDPSNCGSCGFVCDAGTCASGTCTSTYDVGNYTIFSQKSSHSADYLLGTRLVLSKGATLVDFGVISISTGQHVTMALYTESGGHPGTLVAYTASTTLTGSDQTLAPNVNASLPAGNYWIMAVYDASASVGYDTSDASIEVDYVSFTYGSALPTTFPAPIVYYGQQFNYYLVVK